MSRIDLARIRPQAISRYVNRGVMLALRGGLMFFCAVSITSAQTALKQAPSPAMGQVLHAQQFGFPADVLVQGPADTETDLQIICLFHSDPSNTLHGSLIEMNKKLQGLLDVIRTPSLFAGQQGETLLIVPKSGTIPARKLLIIGLGDSNSFTPAVMNLVGSIVFNESSRLGITHPFFAPTVLDGGVSGFNTGEIAEQFMRGFLRARAVEKKLSAAGEAPFASVEKLTFLAGTPHAADTKAGILKAFTPGEPR
jgi:Cytosol aminopeptidase family, N-terminal domain